MSKVLKTAAIVVGALALAATGVGAAASIGAFGTIVTGSATATALATIAAVGKIATVAAVALSLGAQVTAKKPSAQATGSQTSFTANPDDDLPYAIGRTGTAGKITFRAGFDTRDAGDNDRQSFVSVLSIGPIKAIEGQTVDRQPVSYTATGAAIGAFAGFMWSMTQLGALPEAQALGFGADAGSPPAWTALHKLSGKAAASWTLRFDTNAKLFQNGVPAPMWVVQGGLCYDPRKDSTYPGGSGPHRMADPADTAAYDAAVATWEYSECPYLHALKWVHGIWQRDMSDPASKWQRVMGMGASLAGIDVAAFVEGANISDANGWKVGGVLYSSADKWEMLKRILQAGMGEPMPLGARVSCLVNAPKVSLVTITQADLAGAATVQATQPRRDRINTITPRFRLEANNWQHLPGSPISVAEHVALDKGKRSKIQDYWLIQDAEQVGTAVRYDIENAREFGPIVLPLKLYAMGYRPGDCVTANLPEVGLHNQQILLLNRDIGAGSGVVTMTARSETAAKHAFALGQSATPAPTPGVTAPPVTPRPAEGDWNATAMPAGPDVVSPTIVVAGAAKPNVDAIIFEYRVANSGLPWSVAGIDAPTAIRREIVGLKANTAYEVAVSYRARGTIGERRVYGPVITPADAAIELAEGKAEIFFRDVAPSAAESRANDLWINGAGRVFRRVVGSGALAIGGKRILLAGAAVLLPWTLADDQRIGAALVAAGAAQATAERKTETYISETQPIDGTYGDLWFKPSTQELRTFNGTAWVLSSTVGALPEQLEAIEAAADLAGEAKTIADGKARILWRPTAPTAAETDEGDRWVNTAAGNVEYRRMPGTGALSIGGARLLLGGVPVSLPWTRADDQRIAQALGDAAGAQATADGKIETYFSEAVPVADAYGDLWFKPSTGELRRWNGSAWDLVSTIGATAEQLEAIGDALTAAENAQATADGKIVTFFQPEPPAEASEGDLWIDTNAGNALFRYDGAAWIEAQDAGIGAAIGAAAGAQATADGKVTTFVDETPPTADALGDLWFRPSTKELRRWDGDSWDLVATIGATSAEREAIQAAADLADEAKTVADGKARLFYRPTAPAAGEASEGDRWVNTGTGNVEYRRLPGSGQIALAGKRVLLGGSTIVLPWTRADDQRIVASLAAAAGAQATADGKIETYFAETAPIADGVGDLWYRPSTKELRRWSGSAWDIVSTVGATADQMADIQAAKTAIARIVSDNWLTSAEKPQFAREWTAAQKNHAAAITAGAVFPATAVARATATAAYDALAAAIGAIPQYADTAIDSDIAGLALQAKWVAFYDAYAALLIATDAARKAQVDTAQQTADGKSRTFRQAIAPSAADSRGGDLWINTASGNRTYQRLNGSGQLAIGSMRVVLAGKTVLLPWTLAADQRIEDTAAQAAASAAALAAAQARLAAVATDASEAKAIADGKIDSFYQASAPTNASEGDIWFDTDDGFKQYRFTGGAWAIARDTGIGVAINAASGAQSTADRKVRTFIGAASPTAEGVGDLWYDTTAGRLKRWSGTEWVATADDTAANQHSMQDLGAVVFTYNPDGTPGAPGQFPTTALSSRLLGQQDVSPQADWSLDVPSGVNATINNAPGALQRGMITITAPFTVEAATVVVRSTYAGVTLTKLLQIRKGYTSTPATGGGGSGSGSNATPGNPASATSFTSPESSPTRVVMATLPAVAVGGSGNVRLSTSLTFTVAPGDEGDFGYLYGIWAYSTNGGGAWSDVGSATMSSGASNYFSLEMPKGPRSEPGSLEVNVDKTDLTGGASVIFRLEGFSSGRYVASVTGSATAKPL